MRLYRQFTHLVEEDGTLVGDAEISFAFADGSGEGTFLMTEEFAVDSSLWDTAAVDGEISFASSRRVIVNDSWDDFLTHTALSDDKHGKVGRCHLQGDIESTVQSVAISDDIVALFYFL